MSKDIVLAAGFVASGLGATGLTVTVDIWRVAIADLSKSEIVTAGSAVEVGDGIYCYRVASADLQTYYYYAVFKTAGTADVKHLFGAQLDFSGNTGDTFARIGAPAGASVSADIAALPTAASIWAYATRTLSSVSALASSIASAVLDATASSYNTSGTIGQKINSASDASGSGSSTYVMTVRDVNGVVLDGVEVWVTSDLAGASTVASGTTDSAGHVTFYLDPATYYAWCAEGGQNFSNPTTITVV